MLLLSSQASERKMIEQKPAQSNRLRIWGVRSHVGGFEGYCVVAGTMPRGDACRELSTNEIEGLHSLSC